MSCDKFQVQLRECKSLQTDPRDHEQVNQRGVKNPSGLSESFFFIVTHHVFTLSAFPSVSAAQHDLLCEDLRPSLLSGGLQFSVHADLDGRHRHGDRWAQPLLTSSQTQTVEKLLGWSYCTDGAVFPPCVRAPVRLSSTSGTDSVPGLRDLWMNIRRWGAVVQAAGWMCSSAVEESVTERLTLEWWRRFTADPSANHQQLITPACTLAVCYWEVSLFEPDLPLLATVQHYRTAVHYSTYQQGVDTIIGTLVENNAV